MRDVLEPTHSPFDSGLVPAGLNASLSGADDYDANGKRENDGYSECTRDTEEGRSHDFGRTET